MPKNDKTNFSPREETGRQTPSARAAYARRLLDGRYEYGLTVQHFLKGGKSANVDYPAGVAADLEAALKANGMALKGETRRRE
ncbi:MAG: hypothetical protein LBU11_12495 [Zoogloeaceae bacterium]|jgi:hypothetical protein|nr:hypothetical protein [Zoogloeaceae bacterium]